MKEQEAIAADRGGLPDQDRKRGGRAHHGVHQIAATLENADAGKRCGRMPGHDHGLAAEDRRAWTATCDRIRHQAEPLTELLRLAQALDQRAAQQESAGARRILGGAPQLVVVLLAHCGILLGQKPLVADRLDLGVL